MPVKLVTIIKALYDGFSAQVIHNGQKTEQLSMKTGVIQGCLLSPVLFLVAWTGCRAQLSIEDKESSGFS